MDFNIDFEAVSVYTDSFGRVLEVQTCEYCQRTMPIKIWNGIEDGKETYNILLRSYDYKGRLIWRCNDCAVDMVHRSE
jgi:hypothetical protein